MWCFIILLFYLVLLSYIFQIIFLNASSHMQSYNVLHSLKEFFNVNELIYH